MKKLIILFILSISITAFPQDFKINLSNNFQSQFGSSSDMIALNPIFKLESDTIFNKTEYSKIKRFPKGVSNSDLAYGFLYFSGNHNPIFENEIVFLVKNYMSDKPLLYFDLNGNLDFTDDGNPISFINSFNLTLKNNDNPSSELHYQIGKSEISIKNQEALIHRFSSKYPKSKIVSTNYWLTNLRKAVKLSNTKLDGKPITVMLFDENADGLFSENIDKIFIEPNTIELGKDLSSYLRKANTISKDATFLIHNRTYSLKSLDIAGKNLIITSTLKKANKVFGVGDIISTLKIELINELALPIESLLNNEKYVLLEVGGTWCGGCITQKPIVKEIQNSKKAIVIGVFANDTKASVSKYIDKHDINWQVGLMNDEFKNLFGINSFPTYILISPQGKIEMIDINASKIKKIIENN
ncbi:MAG: TlpA disulfide reductase family protein [Flavobacteriaceae bacterium]